jgi:hypothetical protein
VGTSPFETPGADPETGGAPRGGGRAGRVLLLVCAGLDGLTAAGLAVGIALGRGDALARGGAAFAFGVVAAAIAVRRPWSRPVAMLGLAAIAAAIAAFAWLVGTNGTTAPGLTAAERWTNVAVFGAFGLGHGVGAWVAWRPNRGWAPTAGRGGSSEAGLWALALGAGLSGLIVALAIWLDALTG